MVGKGLLLAIARTQAAVDEFEVKPYLEPFSQGRVLAARRERPASSLEAVFRGDLGEHARLGGHLPS